MIDRRTESRIKDICTMISRDGLTDDRLSELSEVLGTAQWNGVKLWREESERKDRLIATYMASLREKSELLKHAKKPLRRATVQVIAINCGFELRDLGDGTKGLREYVYEFAKRVREL